MEQSRTPAECAVICQFIDQSDIDSTLQSVDVRIHETDCLMAGRQGPRNSCVVDLMITDEGCCHWLT